MQYLGPSTLVRMACALALLSLLAVPAFAGTVIYLNSAADITAMPQFGTMYGVSSYYQSEVSPATAGGNALDNSRVYMYDVAQPGFQMLKWDMGFQTNVIRVYNDVENGWFGGNGHDYLQWSLYGSNVGGENAGDWTLLWDPTAASGTSYADLLATAFNGTFDTATIYRLMNAGYGIAPAAGFGDTFSIDFTLPTAYQYFGIRVSSYSAGLGYMDPEINALAAPIPEPASFLLLGSGLCGIAAKLRRKR